jgi:LmbE family N-acetylglucosaminyl deacetylase
VLAPHPDDDVLGCGGTLYKHAQAGDYITAAYLTTGAKAGSGDMIRQRRDEARSAGGLLGIREFVFWDYANQKLTVSSETVRKMKELLSAQPYDVVYLPCFLDAHRDHRATGALFVRACQNLQKLPECYMYEIWTPLIANRYVDISSVISVKRSAILLHRSQIPDINKNYSVNYVGLNAYRALAVNDPSIRYAEAFLHCTFREYALLFKNGQGA